MIVLDGHHLSIDALHRISLGEPAALAPEAAAAMARNAASTPPGESVLERKRRWLVGAHATGLSADELARAFILGHCAGVGDPLPSGVVRAILAARANVLAGGLTGSRPEAAEVLLAMLRAGVLPEVPSQGSVGAAGDLAPLAYIARVACGYGPEVPGLPRFKPSPKEALALINGATVTATLAALAVARARRVLEAAIAATAMTMEVVQANAGCIDPRPLAARGHAGEQRVAAQLRALLQGSAAVHAGRAPDAFSIRAAPAVLGAALDALEHTASVVSIELNGACDNPLLFEGEWVEAGNFHGAPVALAMDHLKIALASAASQSERRTFRLTYGQLSHGLPSFLVPGTGLNSGFMLAQYTAASLASECKGLAFPASVDSIPTVQHHEDHVSMGPIAARRALEVVERVADIVGIEVLLAAQGLDLRARGRAWGANGEPLEADPVAPPPGIAPLRDAVRDAVPFWEDDGVLQPALAAAGRLVRSGALTGAAAGW